MLFLVFRPEENRIERIDVTIVVFISPVVPNTGYLFTKAILCRRVENSLQLYREMIYAQDVDNSKNISMRTLTTYIKSL